MREKDEVFKRHSAIYTYDLSKLDNVTKVRFVYFLKGRTAGKGFIKELNGRFLVPGCFIVPIEKTKQAEMMFKAWKVQYKKEEVLMR